MSNEMTDGPVGEMAAKVSLPTGYTYLELISKYENEQMLSVKEIVDEESAQLWIKRLSELNYVTWRKCRGYETTGAKVIFKEAYRCQHNTDKRARNVKSSKTTNCEAVLLITVSRVGRKSCTNPGDLKVVEDYPTRVVFRHGHNHPLTAFAVLKLLSQEVINKLLVLFQFGHSPPSALHIHKLDLQIEHKNDYFDVREDEHLMPSRPIIQHLFANVFLKEHGPYNSDLLFDDLKRYINDYENQVNGIVSFHQTTCGTLYFAVICTPLMIRAHKTAKQSSELVFIDGCGGVDKQKHRIYTIATPTAAGGIPLGIIVTSGNCESNFQEALLVFRDVVVDWGFYSRQQPRVIVTDLKEIKAVRKVFPNSKTYLCQFRLLKDMQGWLRDPTNEIEHHRRQEAFGLFRKILYAPDAETADEELLNLIFFAEENQYNKFRQYVTNMYDKKEEWVSCFRQGLPLLASDTTIYVQVIFRIIKSAILSKPSGYNILQLVDFIVRSYDNYTRSRFHDFSYGRLSSAVLINTFTFDAASASCEVRNTDNDFIFKVVNPYWAEKECLVDFESGYCSCAPHVVSEKLCKHASAVILMFEKDKICSGYNSICQNTKYMYFYLAFGRSPEEDNLLSSDSDSDAYQTRRKKKNRQHSPQSRYTEKNEDRMDATAS